LVGGAEGDVANAIVSRDAEKALKGPLEIDDLRALERLQFKMAPAHSSGYRDLSHRSSALKMRVQATANVSLPVDLPSPSEPISDWRKDANACWHRPPTRIGPTRCDAEFRVHCCRIKKGDGSLRRPFDMSAELGGGAVVVLRFHVIHLCRHGLIAIAPERKFQPAG
jgi:hypothetical protein